MRSRLPAEYLVSSYTNTRKTRRGIVIISGVALEKTDIS